MVAAAALAAVLGFPPTPSDRAVPPPGFTSEPPEHGPAAAPTTPPGAAAPRAGQDPPPPRRVLAPRTGLDARISPVGVTARGTMTVPDDPSVAGWYRHGPAPGSARGSAVVVGHVDTETGALGEFLALYGMRRGDRIEVRRAGAEPVTYQVATRFTVPKEALPPSTFRRAGPPTLTLITCAPPYDPERGGYVSNLVVTAEPVGRTQWPT
ncbi:hypothetical protein GCM10017668_46110 [Streptomyces tuirus]|uniref:Class F sortase n=1 Tax=Streptomyces tuirus TaxID=68278 RepID=A0A7G1NHX3_9ACTN|nr:hypothetical protein GCM10017668_46110 [Streptomyces tuirus]